MIFNPDTMIQQIQTKMMKMIEKMTGQAALTLSAYDAEKSLLSELLSMGALCLQLYYDTNAKAHTMPKTSTPEGVKLPLHSHKSKQLVTLFGDITIQRPYYYSKGKGGFYPSDRAINLPKECYSDCVQEMYGELAVGQAYQHGNKFMQRWLGLCLSSRAVQHTVLEAGSQREQFVEELEAPQPIADETILVVQSDGKGVPMVMATETQAVRMKKGQARSRKKEAIVTSMHTQRPRVRTVSDVMGSLFKEEAQVKQKQPVTSNKIIWATLKGKETAMSHLHTETLKRDHAGIRHKIALCDGAKSLQAQFREKFPDFLLMLDFIHANEYLWKVANVIYDEQDPQRLVWVKLQTELMLSSKTTLIIEHLRQLAQQHGKYKAEKLQKIANYFERNLPYMDYAHCLRLGLPIASGVIEGACRHIVKDRMELSGMRWTQNGAEMLLQLRCVYHNGYWDAFWEYRRNRRIPVVSAGLPYHSMPLAA